VVFRSFDVHNDIPYVPEHDDRYECSVYSDSDRIRHFVLYSRSLMCPGDNFIRFDPT
jgi:hypothetical protein